MHAELTSALPLHYSSIASPATFSLVMGRRFGFVVSILDTHNAITF